MSERSALSTICDEDFYRLIAEDSRLLCLVPKEYSLGDLAELFENSTLDDLKVLRDEIIMAINSINQAWERVQNYLKELNLKRETRHNRFRLRLERAFHESRLELFRVQYRNTFWLHGVIEQEIWMARVRSPYHVPQLRDERASEFDPLERTNYV